MPTNSKQYMYDYQYWLNWHKKYRTEEKQKENATRMRARRNAEKKWLVHKWKNDEVDHKNWVKAGNWAGNIRIISRETNRKLGAEKAIATRKKRLANWGKY